VPALSLADTYGNKVSTNQLVLVVEEVIHRISLSRYNNWLADSQSMATKNSRDKGHHRKATDTHDDKDAEKIDDR